MPLFARLLSPGAMAWRLLVVHAMAMTMAMTLATRSAAAELSMYLSPTTSAYFPSVGGNYGALLEPWRGLLAAQGWDVRELTRVEDLAGLKPGVLILPSALALNVAERAALLRYRDDGGSILATWAIGSRDEQGRWLGHDFARELFDVRVVGDMSAETETNFLIPYGDTPLNHSIAAGRRTWLGKLPERPLMLAGGIEAAAYLSWSRQVLTVGDHRSAIVFDESTRPGRSGPAGRWVMLGFAETAWGFQPEQIHPIVADALQWLGRVPTAQLATWPNGFRAAQVIEMDTEEGFGNAIHFAELMESINSAGTFYALTSEARKNADLVRRLARRHEIGFHGEVHIGFRWLGKDKQQRRLDRMLAEMIDILGKSPDGWPAGAGRGFRAPTEAYDATTEQVLHAMGFRHHAADPNSSDDRLPFFSPAAPSDPALGLVVLPRGQLDDLSYTQLNLSAEQAGAALIAEYELNLRMGGLGLLSVHSQNFADTNNLLPKRSHTTLMTLAVEDLTRHIGPRHEKAWIAPAGEVSDWWRARSRSTLSVRRSGRQLDLTLTIVGTMPVSGLTVLVFHPATDAQPQFQARRPGAALPTLRKLDRLSSALVFGALSPGTHTLRVTFP